MITTMTSTLASQRVATVLERLHAKARFEDSEARQRVQACESELGIRLAAPQRYELYGDAPLAITPEVGELYYLLVTARRANRIVEFGASHGISTIYLACALRDLPAGGSLITTEILPAKALVTRRNLAEAGLGDLVEIRLGDARDTLGDLPQPVDILVLDGRNDLYIPILEVVEPKLAPNALIIADLGTDDPDLQAYQQHVRLPHLGWHSITLPLDACTELTLRPAVPGSSSTG